MKTENFDEAFRRKIESFHPPFQEDEIDRVQAYVNQRIPLSFWQRFGHTFAYSAGAIVIVSLLTSTLYQANENKILLSKIAILSKKSEQKPVAITTENVPKNIILTKTDTVYVIKYLTKTNPLDDKSSVQSEPLVENIIDRNLIIPNGGEKNLSYQNAPTKSFENDYNANNSITKSPSYEVQKNNFIVKNNPQDIITKTTITELPENESVLLEKNVKPLIISELNYKKLNFINSEMTNNLVNRALNLPNYWVKSNENKANKLPNITLPNLKYRVGLGTNADAWLVGTSVLTEVLFAKHWSVTTGVNIAFLGFERFGNEADFKRKKEKDFRDKYFVNVPTSNQIEGIETHQFLFRIPIYLNYRLPLRKNYTALFSTGTDLDFQLRQATSYSHHDFSPVDEKDNFTEKIPVVPFNNWLFSAGIEKRWNHFSLQFSPYFSTQIKQIPYRNQDYSFGIKLNGFYRLKSN